MFCLSGRFECPLQCQVDTKLLGCVKLLHSGYVSICKEMIRSMHRRTRFTVQWKYRDTEEEPSDTGLPILTTFDRNSCGTGGGSDDT